MHGAKKTSNTVAGLHLLSALQGVTWGRKRGFVSLHMYGSIVRLLKPVIARIAPLDIYNHFLSC